MKNKQKKVLVYRLWLGASHAYFTTDLNKNQLDHLQNRGHSSLHNQLLMNAQMQQGLF